MPPFVVMVKRLTQGPARRSNPMANYLLVYHGGGTPESKEEQAKVMQAWTDWFSALGPAIVDGGNPASQSKSVTGDGSVSDVGSDPVTGYSIIQADSLDQAIERAKGCPIFAGPRTARIEVVETFQAM
jgi:hypothetical protein